MKIRKARKKRIDIADSGALSDLAFLLIIFFIVIAVFNINKGFILELPKPNSTKVVNHDDIVRARLDAEGLLLYNGEELAALELERQVTERLIYNPNLTFMLSIDPEARYQRVVEVVEVVRKLKVDNFSFTMQEEDQ